MLKSYASACLLPIAVALMACGPSVRPPVEVPLPAEPNRIVIYDYKFNPPRLSVAPGTKVTWINMDLIRHTATAQFLAEPFDSKGIGYQTEYSYTFTKPGEYPYICVPHPGMKGVIVVEEPAK